MKCSFAIIGHNEEKNIKKILGAILRQKLEEAEIDEIFVVASGCTDKTVPIAKTFEEKDSRIKVLVQEKRKGKYSAINIFLAKARNEILVMESADTIPEEDAVENLLKPFSDSKIGMTGSRPVPIDNPKTFLGFCVHLLWDLHHQISLKTPKTGEMVAFRKVFSEIPPTAVDEAYMEGLIKGKGYKVVYAPGAVVYNKGPETVSDFLKQRRRIYAGHLELKEKAGYSVSTMSPFILFSLIVKKMKINPRQLSFLAGAILLEVTGRFLGWWDYRVEKKSHVVWDMAATTRNLKERDE